MVYDFKGQKRLRFLKALFFLCIHLCASKYCNVPNFTLFVVRSIFCPAQRPVIAFYYVYLYVFLLRDQKYKSKWHVASECYFLSSVALTFRLWYLSQRNIIRCFWNKPWYWSFPIAYCFNGSIVFRRFKTVIGKCERLRNELDSKKFQICVVSVQTGMKVHCQIWRRCR